SSAAWFGGSYAVDLLRWLAGDEVIRVYAASSSRVLDSIGFRTPDFFTATLEFSRGAVATMETCWTLPSGGPADTDIRAQVIGAEGMVFVDASHHRMVEQYGRINVGGPKAYPEVMTAPCVYGHHFGPAVESLRH